MNTKLAKQGLVALLTFTALTLAAPAMAGHNNYANQGKYKNMQTQNYSGNSYNREHNRSHNRNDNRHRGWNRGNNRGSHYGHDYRVPRSWRQVRGTIIKVGRGAYSNCFRVKRQGRYQGSPAIVTVRYCEDMYGQPKFQRGTKRLIRYTRPAYYSW
ncbi:MAG: hypothetical protein COA47_10545 [Robiginitomaculum sp.]|nr:MAG: hypothetical protein COA47_10545 [Robiginitomaculum sp.]